SPPSSTPCPYTTLFRSLVRSVKVISAQKDHGRARFDEEQDLRGLYHGKKIRDGLVHTVIEDAEILAPQAVDKVSVSARYNHTHIDAVHGYLNLWRLLLLPFLGSRGKAAAQRDSEK